jgi:thiamine biosynthesis lipoprotein ApbE
MKAIAYLIVGFLFIGSNLNADVPKKPKQQLYVSNYENVLGTSLQFKITSTSETNAERAENAALAEIDRLSNIFSAYNDNSEFSQWIKQDLNKPVKVSKEFFEMLSLFEQWKSRTKGALDASAAVATKLWSNAAKKQQVPTQIELNNAVNIMQRAHYKLNTTEQTATRLTNTPLILNTFAKSYIINLACDAALATGNINSVVVNIGGDLVIKGDVKDPINVTNPLANAENDAPLAHLLVSNKAVATSGNYRRGEQIGNRWYSHIVDPRTATPVEGIISATVIAPNATDAGALATAFNVLSIEESQKLAATVKDAEYLIITKDGKRIESEGWKTLIDPNIKEEKTIIIQPIFNGAAKPWDPKFELAVTFEFNAIAGNTHRPFAAIWVENENKESVRNLALWYNKTKWIPDLRNWYRINGERFKADKNNYASVTGATRSPGKYTIKWDGKDDNGNYVAQGKYTIIIETSKEHGTDEIIRQQMELKKSPKKATNSGNVEISNVNFDFYKK